MIPVSRCESQTVPNQNMFLDNPAIPLSGVLEEPMDDLSPARYSIRDILRKAFPTYLENYPVNLVIPLANVRNAGRFKCMQIRVEPELPFLWFPAPGKMD